MTPQEIAINDAISFLSNLEDAYAYKITQIIELKARLERALEKE